MPFSRWGLPELVIHKVIQAEQLKAAAAAAAAAATAAPLLARQPKAPALHPDLGQGRRQRPGRVAQDALVEQSVRQTPREGRKSAK